MKSNSNHFKGTNGARKGPLLKLNIQLFASNYSRPKLTKDVNVEKQMKHLNGTPNKSQLCITLDECKTLVKNYSGTGTMYTENQEIVNFGKIIGYISTPAGNVPTQWGKIHYSKTGTHLVPYYQQKKGK